MSRFSQRIGEEPAPTRTAKPKKVPAIKLWAIPGTIIVLFEAIVLIAWVTGPNFKSVSHGVTPVFYGEGLAERLKAAAPNGIDAFIDLFGPEYVQLAVDLGIPPDRIETIISREKAQEVGAKTEGSGDASTIAVLSEMAGLVASGRIEIPIAATYPLDKVRDAFAELEQRHTRGKIVLIP